MGALASVLTGQITSQLMMQTPAFASQSIFGEVGDVVADTMTHQTQLLAVTLSSRSLRLGDSGTDVRSLQRYLSRNGLYTAPIDGVYGESTADAVATYQRIRDLPATGIANEETLADMDFEFVSAAAQPIPVRPAADQPSVQSGGLALGSTGSDVIALQQRLNDFGIPVFVDGDYGFETQQGVRTYQRVQGLSVTGNADRETLRAMGFDDIVSSNRYVAAVIADESQLREIQQYFPDAFIDSIRRGQFINIGSFDTRFPAEARVNAAIARGFSTRVIYR